MTHIAIAGTLAITVGTLGAIFPPVGMGLGLLILGGGLIACDR